MPDLLEQLRSLEMALHHPGVRSSAAQLEALLHADFYEIGRSGRQYDRQATIQPGVASEHFAVSRLARDVALLTYRSAHRDAGGALTNHTHRASVWIDTPMGWQLRYHQGTPAAAPW